MVLSTNMQIIEEKGKRPITSIKRYLHLYNMRELQTEKYLRAEALESDCLCLHPGCKILDKLLCISVPLICN